MRYYLFKCKCGNKWIQQGILVSNMRLIQCSKCYSRDKRIIFLTKKDIHKLLNKGLK
jgi:hypothetical protein